MDLPRLENGFMLPKYRHLPYKNIREFELGSFGGNSFPEKGMDLRQLAKWFKWPNYSFFLYKNIRKTELGIFRGSPEGKLSSEFLVRC